MLVGVIGLGPRGSAGKVGAYEEVPTHDKHAS